MKKRWILALLLVALMLTGCSREKNDFGPVVAVLEDAVILRVPGGTETAFLLGEDTMTFSWVEGISWKDLKPDMTVSVKYGGWKKTYTAPDGTRYPGYAARVLMIDEVREEEPVILSDGTEVWLWRGTFGERFRLADGTELLWTDDLHMDLQNDPQNEAAYAKIQAYYDAQGILYDPMSLLEQAWEAFRKTQPGEEFQSFHASQMVRKTAVSEGVIYCETSLSLPVDGWESSITRQGTAFDRETGEVIPLADLFTCPPEEIPAAVLDACYAQTNALRDEAVAAFLPQYVTFARDGVVEVTFPKGSLPSEKNAFIFVAELEKLESVLQPWAVPEIQE